MTTASLCVLIFETRNSPQQYVIVADMAPSKGGLNSIRQRCVAHATLLWLIDPVRGPPTVDLIESNPDEDIVTGPLQLWWKFLDSFALICSTSEHGKETASAVCMEQSPSRETILRVARNRGLAHRDLGGLNEVLRTLVAVAKGGKSWPVMLSMPFLLIQFSKRRKLPYARPERHSLESGCYQLPTMGIAKAASRPRMVGSDGQWIANVCTWM